MKSGLKLGVITRAEQYSSLETFSGAALSALRERFLVHHLRVDANTSIDTLQAFYRKSDFVVNLGSKAIDYDRGYQVPTLFFGHAWMDHGAGITLYRNRNHFRPYDAIVFASSAALNKYRLVYPSGIPSYLLPFFATPARSEMTPERAGKLRSRLGLDGNTRIVLYFGRLTWEKNITGLIESYSAVRQNNCCLVIAGSFGGPTTFGFSDVSPQSYRLAVDQGINRVKGRKPVLVGRLLHEEVLELLALSWVSVNMSLCREEDFGLSALESLQTGVPVVCSDWAGLRDVVKHGEVGYRAKTRLNGFVPIVDNAEATSYLSRILDDEQLRQKLSSSARERAFAEFSKEAFIERISAIIELTQSRYTSPSQPDQPMLPVSWIERIYVNRIQKRTLHKIYEDPRLFETLYSCYASS